MKRLLCKATKYLIPLLLVLCLAGQASACSLYATIGDMLATADKNGDTGSADFPDIDNYTKKRYSTWVTRRGDQSLNAL